MNLFPKTETLSFRKWIDLEHLKSKLIEAVETDEFAHKAFLFVSTAFGIPVKKLESMEWDKAILLLANAYKQFYPNTNVPLLKDAPKGDGQGADWEYDGRGWHYYSHILAKSYGWSLEYIAALDVNEALGKLQEILTDDQLEKEFYYGLSEVAYRYDKGSKKSSFVPMKRPYWMKPNSKPIKKVKMLRSMIPQGRVVDISGLPEEYAIDGLVTEKPK